MVSVLVCGISVYVHYVCPYYPYINSDKIYLIDVHLK